MTQKRHVVEIGKLRHRITFESNEKVSDGQGGMVKTWAPIITVWASIDPVSQWEKVYTQAMQTRRTHKITVRLSATIKTITTEMRITYGDRTFQIKAFIDPDERGFYYMIDAEENVGS